MGELRDPASIEGGILAVQTGHLVFTPFNTAQSEYLNVVDHQIFAESLAAFVDWALDEQGQLVNAVNNGVLVVDVGGGTTDISFINQHIEVGVHVNGPSTTRC